MLSDSSALFQGSVLTTSSSAVSAQVKRIILELGRQHSAEAAFEAFHWFKDRAGGEALPSSYHACITACVWNGGLTKALELYHESTAAGHKCTLHVFNVLIAACGRTGALDTAMEVRFCHCQSTLQQHTGTTNGNGRVLQLLRALEAAGLEPNTFTFMLFLEACNYKGCGKCDVALALFSRMLQTGMTVPDVAKAKLVAVRVLKSKVEFC